MDNVQRMYGERDRDKFLGELKLLLEENEAVIFTVGYNVYACSREYIDGEVRWTADLGLSITSETL